MAKRFFPKNHEHEAVEIFMSGELFLPVSISTVLEKMF